MEKFLPYITYILTALIVILILKFVFKFGIKTIIKLIINIIAGGMVLFMVNLIPGLNLPINITNSLLVGIFGLPGVIFILIYNLFWER